MRGRLAIQRRQRQQAVALGGQAAGELAVGVELLAAERQQDWQLRMVRQRRIGRDGGGDALPLGQGALAFRLDEGLGMHHHLGARGVQAVDQTTVQLARPGPGAALGLAVRVDGDDHHIRRARAGRRGQRMVVGPALHAVEQAAAPQRQAGQHRDGQCRPTGIRLPTEETLSGHGERTRRWAVCGGSTRKLTQPFRPSVTPAQRVIFRSPFSQTGLLPPGKPRR
ncbi:MAG TPA: hypothetical protein PKE61_13300 [Burkholderiaceae bacterium]|nr:hypothetical protein [Burkholderiaceae bacterium]